VPPGFPPGAFPLPVQTIRLANVRCIRDGVSGDIRGRGLDGDERARVDEEGEVRAEVTVPGGEVALAAHEDDVAGLVSATALPRQDVPRLGPVVRRSRGVKASALATHSAAALRLVVRSHAPRGADATPGVAARGVGRAVDDGGCDAPCAHTMSVHVPCPYA